MTSEKINFKQKFSKFTKKWSPRVIAEMNDYQFKIAKIKGEFVWHDHKDTDETFIVLRGKCQLNLEIVKCNCLKGKCLLFQKALSINLAPRMNVEF